MEIYHLASLPIQVREQINRRKRQGKEMKKVAVAGTHSNIT